jgi:membrane-associated protein
METLQQLANLVLHLDHHLLALVNHYGAWAYALLFAIIFCETGLVVTPFLPGDSLLFAAGTLASTTSIDINLLFVLLVSASILGNFVNYSVGRFLGPKVFKMPQSRLLNPRYLIAAEHFYQRHGGKAIIMARFMPIIRTFAPFVAGIARMERGQFLLYNVLGAVLWVGSLLYSSYWFGNLPFIKEHFSAVVMGILVLSVLPPFVGYLRQRLA